jgi:hypothetical protein
MKVRSVLEMDAVTSEHDRDPGPDYSLGYLVRDLCKIFDPKPRPEILDHLRSSNVDTMIDCIQYEHDRLGNFPVWSSGQRKHLLGHMLCMIGASLGNVTIQTDVELPGPFVHARLVVSFVLQRNGKYVFVKGVSDSGLGLGLAESFLTAALGADIYGIEEALIINTDLQLCRYVWFNVLATEYSQEYLELPGEGWPSDKVIDSITSLTRNIMNYLK